jgi:hypothetical protein
MNNTTKGAIASAQVVYAPTTEYGVHTEWAVQLSFHSPTGDSSDFIHRQLPCLYREQAVEIADYYNAQVCPHLVGKFNESLDRFHFERETDIFDELRS